MIAKSRNYFCENVKKHKKKKLKNSKKSFEKYFSFFAVPQLDFILHLSVGNVADIKVNVYEISFVDRLFCVSVLSAFSVSFVRASG